MEKKPNVSHDEFDYPLLSFRNKLEKKQLERYGYYLHFVIGEMKCPNNFNIHTHGLQERFNHPDIQMCYPLAPNQAKLMIKAIVDKLKSGERMEINKEYFGLLANDYKIQFISAKESGREVLRIVFPDKNNEYKTEAAKCQFEMLDNE